jgi:hypothetical protein
VCHYTCGGGLLYRSQLHKRDEFTTVIKTADPNHITQESREVSHMDILMAFRSDVEGQAMDSRTK